MALLAESAPCQCLDAVEVSAPSCFDDEQFSFRAGGEVDTGTAVTAAVTVPYLFLGQLDIYIINFTHVFVAGTFSPRRPP